jgi:hypothetical protein
MSLTGSFKFVRIPADIGKPIENLEADKAGGLAHDALVQNAKTAFYEMTGGRDRAQQLEKASPEERQALVAQIRQQMQDSCVDGDVNASSIEHLTTLDDDAVLNLAYTHQLQPSCDITALTVPGSVNGYQAVSMYVAENGEQHGLAKNARALALLMACGHTAGAVFGDVFVGRAHDDEVGDIWERVDFLEQDADPNSDWCRIARSRGGGGGSGRAAASLSNLMSQQNAHGSAMQVIGANTTDQQGDALFGMNGAPPILESWGSWTQTDDEVVRSDPLVALPANHVAQSDTHINLSSCINRSSNSQWLVGQRPSIARSVLAGPL